MNSGTPAFLRSKTHILPTHYSILLIHWYNVDYATVVIVSVLDDVW